MRSKLLVCLIVQFLAFFCVSPASSFANRPMARALVEEGEAWLQVNKTAEALARFERAMNLAPSYELSYQRALPLWMKSKKYAEAERRLQILTLRCPHCSFAWYALGAVYRKQGRFSLAVEVYEIYLQRNAQDLDAQFGLAMALAGMSSPQALQVLAAYRAAESRPSRQVYRDIAEREMKRLRKGLFANADFSDWRWWLAPHCPSGTQERWIVQAIASRQWPLAQSGIERYRGKAPQALDLWGRLYAAQGKVSAQGMAGMFRILLAGPGCQ